MTLWPASVFRDYSVILARWQVEEEELERESGIQNTEYRSQKSEVRIRGQNIEAGCGCEGDRSAPKSFPT